MTLCRRCHAKVHRTLYPRFTFPAELRELWREAHPDQAEQLCFDLSARFGHMPAEQQPALFEAAA